MLHDGVKHGTEYSLPVTEYSVTGTTYSAPTVTTLDWIERCVVLALYAWFAARIAIGCAGSASLINYLLLVSEGLIVFLVLIRRAARDISPRPIDWIMAFAATTAPLLVQPVAKSEGQAGGALTGTLWLAGIAAAIMLMGFLIQVHAKLILGRCFGCVAANRGVKFAGPYRMVRHPMYLGYLLTHLGFLCVNPAPWNFAAYALCYAIQVPRLLSEERLLIRDRRYRAYARLVRFRLIPGVF
jgi:protein-S-isoprenylcysteine O-methyltransferase Ste14